MAVKNFGGSEILNNTNEYSDERKVMQRRDKAGRLAWESGKVNMIAVLGFSFTDALVIYNIIDAGITDNALMVLAVSFMLAFVLDLLPVYIAKFCRQMKYRIEKNAKLFLILALSMYFILFSAIFYLRFVFSDMYGQEEQIMALENTVSNESVMSEEQPSEGNRKGNALILVLSLLPMGTSVVCFFIAYASDDEITKKMELLRQEIDDNKRQKSEVEAAVLQKRCRVEAGIEPELNEDARLMEAAKADILHRGEILKSLTRKYLEEYLSDPSAITRISQEMRDMQTPEDTDMKTLEAMLGKYMPVKGE